MKKIEAIIKPFKLDDVREALSGIGAPVEFGMALLPAETFDLGHGHAGDTDAGQCLTHVIQFERFDDRLDFLHISPGSTYFTGEKYPPWTCFASTTYNPYTLAQNPQDFPTRHGDYSR